MEGGENQIIYKSEKVIELQILCHEATHEGQTYIFCHVISHQSNEKSVVKDRWTGLYLIESLTEGFPLEIPKSSRPMVGHRCLSENRQWGPIAED